MTIESLSRSDRLCVLKAASYLGLHDVESEVVQLMLKDTAYRYYFKGNPDMALAKRFCAMADMNRGRLCLYLINTEYDDYFSTCDSLVASMKRDLALKPLLSACKSPAEEYALMVEWFPEFMEKTRAYYDEFEGSPEPRDYESQKLQEKLQASVLATDFPTVYALIAAMEKDHELSELFKDVGDMNTKVRLADLYFMVFLHNYRETQQ